MIKKYLTYIGIIKSIQPEPVPAQAFNPTKDIDVAKQYLTYLKEIDNYQKNRRATIENKNSQLVGQASIVTSIYALFIPLLIGSFNSVSLLIKIPLTLIFLIVLAHYLLTIFHAIKTLKINKYKYATRKTTTITKATRATTELDFLNEEMGDLVYTVNKTSLIDNIKGENLLLGARNFEIANFGFGIMTLLIILSTFTIKKETPELKINNLKEIYLAVPDTINTRLLDFQTVDSLTIRIDSSNNKVLIQNEKVK